MSIEDQVREQVEDVPYKRELIAGYYVPTEEEGDPHGRVSGVENDVVSLYAGLMLLARQVDDLGGRLDRIKKR